ncbi:MAG: ATP-dependent DNA helicase RecG [Prevotella sp.]|nr:ATP-dependent DNA helicase RecG [Prevotella sp.]
MSSILDQDIKYLSGVGPQRKEILSKELGINSFGDLLEYYPYKHVDRSRVYKIRELTLEMPFVQIKGRILSFEVFDMGSRKKRLVAHFSDGERVMDLVWFSGVPYIKKTYKVGIEYIAFGRPGVYNGRFQISHPEIDSASSLELNNMGMQPYYNTTEKMKKAGMTSRTLEKLTKNLMEKLPKLPETLPDYITLPLHLMSRDEAMRKVHYPSNQYELQHARERLKFEELFYVQLNILRYAANNRRKYNGYLLPKVGDCFNDFYQHNLPFELTGAQKRVMHEIHKDMNTGRQMNRLIQGDVGSGKTLVALMAMLIAVDNGFQAVMMAPTEILAEQHLETIKVFLGGVKGGIKGESEGVRVELLTGMVKGKRREAVMEGLQNGDVKILVGTHAIIEDNVVFNNLGLAVIDEQHRFGVAQRAKLWSKNDNPPHVLVMTATPIPRTLAMTIYGDLDVSVIDELPPGRKPIMTLHKYENQMTSLYEGIRKEVSKGRQVYVVYPLITESEKMDLQDLEAGYAHLQEVFPQYKMSKVHGRMKPVEKEMEMQRFASGETQILVATTVIEVGVNVPNASVMVIMEAQRFGLSQLHQLRGRVGRGADQSYCILVSDYQLSKETKKRLDIMCETNDGFRIAEADLKLRGPGDLEGTQQSGMAFDLKIANIATDGQIVQLARDEAQKIIDSDHECNAPEHALLWKRLAEIRKNSVDWGVIS